MPTVLIIVFYYWDCFVAIGICLDAVFRVLHVFQRFSHLCVLIYSWPSKPREERKNKWLLLAICNKVIFCNIDSSFVVNWYQLISTTNHSPIRRILARDFLIGVRNPDLSKVTLHSIFLLYIDGCQKHATKAYALTQLFMVIKPDDSKAGFWEHSVLLCYLSKENVLFQKVPLQEWFQNFVPDI